MADLSSASPPGRYPVVVVGSGPGGLQVAYYLRRLGISFAHVSADAEPGGMFRRFPIMGRLVSWTKRHAVVDRDARSYERFDWNSLITEDPTERVHMSELMDGSSYFPARPEMERGIAAFAARQALEIRYGCRWEATSRTGDGFVMGTSDGAYHCRVMVLAVGMAVPWKPSVPGFDQVVHYGDFKEPRAYEGRTVFIVGKRNSGFELADGLLPWARQIFLGSPRPAKVSVITRSLAGARARYLQPYEDHVLGGGNFLVDATIDRVERVASGYRVHTSGTTVPGKFTYEVDDVIAATGFQAPLADLRDIGVRTFLQDRLPTMTPYWESASVPGIYFAGTTSQGATELRKHGIVSASTAVHGHRYNSRVLARHIAARHFGIEPDSAEVAPDGFVNLLLSELTESPVLWHQRGYLARIFVPAENGLIIDRDVQPLAHFLDAPGPDAVGATLESDESSAIYPAIYVRRAGLVSEHLVEPAHMHDFRTSENRALLTDRLKHLMP
ncbi:MAG: NAD(P)-binding domain-containing protein [Actinomycetota bacterium]